MWASGARRRARYCVPSLELRPLARSSVPYKIGVDVPLRRLWYNAGQHPTGGPGMATTKKADAGRRRTKTGMIRARVDPALKARAEKILEAVCLNASDAIRLF